MPYRIRAKAMRTGDYTADAICSSLGIGAFYESFTHGMPKRELRLLLCPPFAPELFISLTDCSTPPGAVRGETPAETKVVLSVTASRTQIWMMAEPGPVPLDHAKSELNTLTFEDLEMKFHSAAATLSQSMVTLDGMLVYAMLRNRETLISMSETPVGDSAFAHFVAEILDIAFSASDTAQCRDALARAGRYVGLDLPVEANSEPSHLKQLGVLGVAEDRHALLRALAAVAGRQAHR